jgi:hypothetical protein
MRMPPSLGTDNLGGVRLVRSSKRKADHGEVFTPRWIVEAMLNLVKQESERIESRFLEPACGSGNFLVPVLRRKLESVHRRYGRSEFENRHLALLAIMSLYGIELLADNVMECRENLIEVFRDYVGTPPEDPLTLAAKTVLSVNIIHGDALAMRTKERPPQPITFAEWSYLGKGRYQRRDFQFSTLAQLSSLGDDTLLGHSNTAGRLAPVQVHPCLTIADLAALANCDG